MGAPGGPSDVSTGSESRSRSTKVPTAYSAPPKWLRTCWSEEYGRYFGMPTARFRGGCLTGPQHAGAVLHGFLAYLMRCTVMDIPYTIFGYKGKQVRDNLHAWIIAAFDAFRRDPRPAAVYNLGGGRYSNVSVLEAITLCEGISARRLSFAITERPRVGDHRWYVSDMAAFKADYPGWRHTVGIEEVLSRRSIGPTSTVGSRADERASAVAGHSPNLAAPPAGARSSTPTWMTGRIQPVVATPR